MRKVPHISRFLRSAGAAALLTVVVSACGSGSSSSSASSPHAATQSAAATPSQPLAVSISGYAYHPAAVTVALHSKVVFTNHDQTAHTATTSKSGFDTGTVKPGQSATITLNTPGTYTYICQFHPFMHGTLTVK